MTLLRTEVIAPVAELEHLPTDRRVALRLLWLLDDPRAPLDEITRAISADPALSARLLSVANASFGGAGRATTLSRAVSMLGAQTIRTFASTAALQLFSACDSHVPESAWLHAVTAGVAAGRLGALVAVNPAEALTTAVIHDIGTTLLYNRDADRFEEMEAAVGQARPERLAIERDYFGVDHAALAAEVLAAGGIPACIVEAVRDHHTADRNASPLARVVRVADAVAKAVEGESATASADLEQTLAVADISASPEHLVECATSDRTAVLRYLGNFLGSTNDKR